MVEFCHTDGIRIPDLSQKTKKELYRIILYSDRNMSKLIKKNATKVFKGNRDQWEELKHVIQEEAGGSLTNFY